MKRSALSVFGIGACAGLLLTGCAHYGARGDAAGGAAPVAANSQQAALFSAIDSNADGVISQAELIRYFQEHDRNGDGKLNASEFAAFESPGLAGPDQPQKGKAHDINANFPQQIRNPEPTGPEVARPSASK